MKIIFINDAGGVSIVHPTPEALEIFSVLEIAVKDVPPGKPFKIVDESYLPTSREAREAWRVDPAELTDGIGGQP